MSAATISIIVPCWRSDTVPENIATTWLQTGVVKEVIIAAVGSNASDSESTMVRRIQCSRAGRGIQMNEAARGALGELLLFHHADTELTSEHLHRLQSTLLAEPSYGGGAFRRRFDERHPFLRWLEPWEALRCRCFGPLFGDQSIFVRREIFEQMGGFADIPLMEDVEFSCRLRRRTKLKVLAPAIRSSPRKHLQQGPWRTTAINALFLALYIFGISPTHLFEWYYRQNNRSPNGSSSTVTGECGLRGRR